MRKSKIKLLASILTLVCIVLVASIAVIVIGKKAMDNYKEQISSLSDELKTNTQTVYVASTDIAAGETLEDGVNVYKQAIYSGMDSTYYMSESELGAIAKIDITTGEPIMESSITTLSITKDTREYEVAVAALMTDQEEYDDVDVRIMFPTGEDYLVLSKVPVRNLHLDTCVFFTYLNEDEIMRMASATIDAYTISGTRIYTTRYVESSLQEEAIPNYLVKAETIDLINKDPNITKIATETLNLQARMDLESRLKALTEDQLKSVAAGHELEDVSKSSVLTSNTYYVDSSNPQAPVEKSTSETEGTEESSEEGQSTEETTSEETTTNSDVAPDVIE